VGESSYTISLKPGFQMVVHQSFLKPCVPDVFNDAPTPLYFHQRTEMDNEVQPDQWVVKTILKHRVSQEGELEFFTRWEGAEKGSETWEPVKHFIHRYCGEWARYCQKKGLEVDIVKFLESDVRAVDAVSFGHYPWVSNDYCVLPEICQQIKAHFQLVCDPIDAFAKQGNSCWPIWWGPGSENPDALSVNWNDTFLWLNPPTLCGTRFWQSYLFQFCGPWL
jgi:hypothetical protein